MKDFVFAEKDGGLAFVGDFEGLYNAEKDPWLQSGQEGDMAYYYAFSRKRIADMLKVHNVSGDGLEIGCGHGHAMKFIQRHGPIMRWTGGDISRTAILTAREKYPSLKFVECDVTKLWVNGGRPAPWLKPFDVVLLNQTLWYVLKDFKSAITNCLGVLAQDGLFVVSQAFLKTEQRYGRDIADGFYGTAHTLVDKFPLKMVHASYDDTGQYVHNDGLMAFRKC